MKARKNFIGLEGFVWWVGVVEDRNDPEQLGRVRVRCFGWHTEDKKKIATNDLPWAHPTIPVNHPAVYTPKEGDMVFGFFMDGDNAQNPVIMGVFPGKPEKKPKYEDGFSDPRKSFGDAPKRPDDNAEAYPKSKYLKEATTNRLARGKADSTIIATRKKNLKKGVQSAGGVTWSEPAPAFAPKYPYNYALETESGHAFELDDTPGDGQFYIAVDLAGFEDVSKQAANKRKNLDETAIAVVKVCEDGWYVDTIVAGRWDIKETANRILETAKSYDVRLIGIERGMAKNAVLPYLQDLMRRKNYFLSVIDLTHGNKKKTDRIVWALQGRFEHGRIKLVRGEWNKQFVDQLLNFPNPQVHDDLIDALAYIDQIGVTEFTNLIEEEEYEALDPISGY